MDALVWVVCVVMCACMWTFVGATMSCPVVFTSGDSSVVSCCFIYYHQRESAGLIL